MECHVHAGVEPVDACRSCGRPICAACAEGSRGTFLCAACAPAAAAPAPVAGGPAGTRGARSPALAALLSFVPGLGQAMNGDILKAVTFFSILVLLVYGTTQAPSLAVFAAFFWFYQVYEAYHTASATSRPPAPPPASSTGAWALVAGGIVLYVGNLTGGLVTHLKVLLPLVVILLGIRLLLSYFRAPGEAAT